MEEVALQTLITVLSSSLVATVLVPRMYEFHNRPLSWKGAFSDCRERGGQLATIYDLGTIAELELDKQPVVSLVFWNGLAQHGPGNWTWADGSLPSWSNWAPEAENGGDCGSATLVSQYQWRREDCARQLPYMCEYQTGVCEYTRIPQSSIAGHNNRMVFGKSAEECKQICTETTAFVCRSFEHNTDFRYCQLSSGNRWTLEGYLRSNDPTHDYYHRKCNVGIFVPAPSSSRVIYPTSTFSPSPSPSSSSPLPSSSYIEVTSWFVYSSIEATSSVITPTPVWDLSTTKLIICTEYNPDDLYTSSILPTETSDGAVSATTLLPVQKVLVELEETVKVAKENARQRTKVSVPDDRPSAKSVGYAAGIIMFGILGAIISLDLISIFKDLTIMKRNLQARRHRHKPHKVILTFDKEAYNEKLKAQRESDKHVGSEPLESMDKSSEPEPDYDRPPSETIDRPRIPRPRMFGRPSMSEQAFSISLRQKSTENLYEDPNCVVPKAPVVPESTHYNAYANGIRESSTEGDDQ